MTAIEVLLCDDHPICHVGVEVALRDSFPNLDFTFHKVFSGREALSLMEKCKLDFIFLDLHLPDMSGLDVLKSRQENGYVDGKTIVLTYDESPAVLLQVLRFKVNAVLLKSYTFEVLAEAVKKVRESSEVFLDPSLKAKLQNELQNPKLSPKEFEVLRLLSQGYSYQDIATRLGLSKDTIKTYRSRIAEKTKLKNRSEMCDWFYRGKEK